jgi:hypothetical protein
MFMQSTYLKDVLQECPNPRRQITRPTKLCTATPDLGMEFFSCHPSVNLNHSHYRP